MLFAMAFFCVLRVCSLGDFKTFVHYKKKIQHFYMSIISIPSFPTSITGAV